jgi:hypothetical protein
VNQISAPAKFVQCSLPTFNNPRATWGYQEQYGLKLNREAIQLSHEIARQKS